MYAAPGVGLAATQIGVDKQLFIIDISREDEPSELRVFVNPELIKLEGKMDWEEGCLSFPGEHHEVERAEHVRVRAQDRNGQWFELEAEGLLAVAVQHENDHLQGKLFVDHLSALKRELIRRRMKKLKTQREAERKGEATAF